MRATIGRACKPSVLMRLSAHPEGAPGRNSRENLLQSRLSSRAEGLLWSAVKMCRSFVGADTFNIYTSSGSGRLKLRIASETVQTEKNTNLSLHLQSTCLVYIPDQSQPRQHHTLHIYSSTFLSKNDIRQNYCISRCQHRCWPISTKDFSCSWASMRGALPRPSEAQFHRLA